MVTVIEEVAVLFPSVVVAVTVAVPTEMAVTNPVSLTVATPVLPELHVIALFEAFAGDTFAVNCFISPTFKLSEAGETETPDTGMVTVIEEVAVLFPSAVVTVIIAIPAETAVTIPVELTDAIPFLSDFHVTDLFEAFDGVTTAVNCCFEPTFKVTDSGDKVIPVTGTVTVMAEVAVLFPSTVVTVIVADPPETAVTKPLSLTIATLLLLDFHVTD
jgi:hypothetical protein